MAETTPDSGWFAQLLYTSYDNGAGRGGWQIKQVTGAIDAAQREELIARIPTMFDLEPRLPDFPNEDDLRTRPARLCYGQLTDGTHAYWHTVEAGRDGSGRPGNVFAHVVVDRRPAGEPAPRPIQLSGSPGWLRPYGPRAVAQATLTSELPPAPNPAVDEAGAIAFVTEGSFEAQQTFIVLFDAVLARLDGGKPVVLVTADHRRSVDWIAAVSFFLPPGAARRFTWSTHDRPDRAAVEANAGTDLICVPAAVGEVAVPGAVVLSEAEVPEIAPAGGEHLFPDGSSVPATPVAELVEGVLSDPDIAAAVLRDQGAIEAQFPGESVAAAWTLAVAVSRHPELAEFSRVALRVIAQRYPDVALSAPWSAELVRRAEEMFPPTTADLLERLRRAHEAGAPTAAPAAAYCAAAIRDGSWETTPLAAIPKVRSADAAGVRQALSVLIGHIADLAQSDRIGALPVALHLGEFVARLAAPGAGRDAVLRELATATSVMSPLAMWPPLVADWPAVAPLYQLSSEVIGRLLRPIMHRGDHRLLLEDTDISIWLNLFDQVPIQRAGGFLPASPTPSDLAIYPYAVLSVLSSPIVALTPQQQTDLAIGAIDACVATQLVSDAQSRDLTGRLIARVPSAGSELGRWSATYPQRIDAGSLATRVLTAPLDPALDETVFTLESTEPNDTNRRLAAALRLRRQVADVQRGPVTDPEAFLADAQHCLELLRTWRAAPVPELLVALDAALVLARSERLTWAKPAYLPPHLEEPIRSDDEATVRFLTQLITMGAMPPAWAPAASFLGFVREQRAGRPQSRDCYLIDRVIAAAVSGGWYQGPDSVEALRDAAWPMVAHWSAHNAELFFNDYRKLAQQWLRDHLQSSEGRRSMWPAPRKDN